MSQEIQQSPGFLKEVGTPVFHVGRMAIVLALVLTLLSVSFMLHTQVAQAYSCNGCHGAVVWPGRIDGAVTIDEIAQLSCNPSACKPAPNYIPHVGNVLTILDTSTNGYMCYPYNLMFRLI